MRSISKTYAALILLTVFLAGCDSPEERAEAHYQRAMALLAEGDATSAHIEFRNALQQDQALSKARLEYARSLASEGNAREAAGHYLRLVEQNPDDGVSHLELARVAIGMGDFQTASTHVRRAFELLPDDPGAKELMATVVFREGDPERGVAMANEVLAETPSSVPARLVLIAERVSAEDFATALDITEAALADAPDDPDLNVARLALLERLGDTQGVGEQLGRMLDADPDNQQTAQALLRWHLAQGDEGSALALLRDIAERSPEDPTGRLNVAQFILETDGREAARAELQRLVDTEAENAPFLQALAQLDFALGRREEAIAGLRTLTSVEEDSPELRDLRVALARMLLATAERDEAATLVEAVLAADPQHVDALKMRARRSIDADSPEQALLDLNSALARAPDDPDILTLMAEAHEREGAHDLAGQRLARAVEASDFRAAESLRYAGYLVADGRLGPAEDTLLDALKRAPQNLDLLSLLGRVHLEREDYGRVRQLAGTIRETGVTGSAELANGLELAALQAEGRTEEMVGALSELATDGSEDIRPKLALIQTHLASGDTDAASDVVDQLLAEDPGNLAARYARAAVQVMRGETDAAEATYRGLIAESPRLAVAHQALVALLARTGRGAEAEAALAAGIAATDRDPSLLVLESQRLMAAEDFEGAIAIFEELYALDTSNVVVANNLASLLSSHRSDQESLDRAFQVARRLRGSENPYFQDTYGWLLTGRGDYQQALTYLEPAAAALTSDALTQFHLAETYFALERWDDARAAFETAIEVAGPDSDQPQIAEARARIDEIAAMVPEAPEEPEAPEAPATTGQ